MCIMSLRKSDFSWRVRRREIAFPRFKNTKSSRKSMSRPPYVVCGFVTQCWSQAFTSGYATAKLTQNHNNFLGGIFVALVFVEIFNFIGYANNTTCDITLHDFRKSFVYLKVVKLFNTNEGA